MLRGAAGDWCRSRLAAQRAPIRDGPRGDGFGRTFTNDCAAFCSALHMQFFPVPYYTGTGSAMCLFRSTTTEWVQKWARIRVIISSNVMTNVADTLEAAARRELTAFMLVSCEVWWIRQPQTSAYLGLLLRITGRGRVENTSRSCFNALRSYGWRGARRVVPQARCESGRLDS